jgi:hypothetical protein
MVAPRLTDPLTDALTAAKWFQRIGLPLEDSDRRLLEAATGGDAAQGDIVVVASWSDAARILDAEDRDSRNWDAQEEERERLWDVCCDRHLEADLLEELHAMRTQWGPSVEAAAHAAASRAGIADPRFVHEAGLAAQLALGHGTLAMLADAGDAHPFRQTLELFLRGRWPLGSAGGRITIF